MNLVSSFILLSNTQKIIPFPPLFAVIVNEGRKFILNAAKVYKALSLYLFEHMIALATAGNVPIFQLIIVFLLFISDFLVGIDSFSNTYIPVLGYSSQLQLSFALEYLWLGTCFITQNK